MVTEHVCCVPGRWFEVQVFDTIVSETDETCLPGPDVQTQTK